MSLLDRRIASIYRRCAQILLTVAGFSAMSAQAAAFPERPLTLIVPYAPGATTDQIARSVADRMGRVLGQTVVVENRVGANGIIAATRAAQSKPDGYTLLLASDSSVVLNPLLYKNLSYDPDKDFAPLALLSNLPLIMSVSPKLPVTNLKEFIAYAKAHPRAINYSSTGIGGTYHLAGELFSMAKGVELTHVPYKGGAPALTALMTNEVQALFGVLGSQLPQIKTHKIRPLAVAGTERLALVPEVPTFEEQGIRGFDVVVRYGLVVPAGTPPEAMKELAAAVNTVLTQPDFRKQFEDLGFMVPARSGPDHYASLIKQDREMWADLIQKKNITLE